MDNNLNSYYPDHQPEPSSYRNPDSKANIDGALELSSADIVFPHIDFSTPAQYQTESAQAAGPNLSVAATNDIELAQAYINNKSDNGNTVKSIKIELGRFLLWCHWKGLRLADLRVENLDEYKRLLLDPKPEHIWISTPSESKSAVGKNGGA
jgi:hypothetical protein